MASCRRGVRRRSGYGCTSNAPTSHPPPAGRRSPRWSAVVGKLSELQVVGTDVDLVALVGVSGVSVTVSRFPYLLCGQPSYEVGVTSTTYAAVLVS